MRNIVPNWPVPSTVKAYSTTREGGVSSGPYSRLNLGDHVGDEPAIVDYNRQILRRDIGLLTEPHWLNQVHGAEVKYIDGNFIEPIVADASVTALKNQACIVMTADCLPILLCDKTGTTVAAVHGGWRGLKAGVIEAAVSKMACSSGDLLAWLGPAISQKHYEVGAEVYEAFGSDFQKAFIPGTQKNRFMADLYEIARIQLAALGLTAVYGGEFCTYSDSRFYSFRRDQGVTGRMASLIWLSDR